MKNLHHRQPERGHTVAHCTRCAVWRERQDTSEANWDILGLTLVADWRVEQQHLYHNGPWLTAPWRTEIEQEAIAQGAKLK